MSACYIYRFFDAEDQLLYVGVADNPGARWKAHHASEWWPRVAEVSVEKLATRDEALESESLAIATERPLFNVNGLKGSSAKVRQSLREAQEAYRAVRFTLVLTSDQREVLSAAAGAIDEIVRPSHDGRRVSSADVLRAILEEMHPDTDDNQCLIFLRALRYIREDRWVEEAS